MEVWGLLPPTCDIASAKSKSKEAPEGLLSLPNHTSNTAQAKASSRPPKATNAQGNAAEYFQVWKKIHYILGEMCVSRNSITPRTMSGKTKSSRTEYASSLAAEAFLTRRTELIRSAHLLLRTTRELDECERAKASAGTISVESRFLHVRESNNEPNITEQKRTELLRQLYQDGRDRRDDAGIAVGIGAANIEVHGQTGHQVVERVHDDSHWNQDVNRPSSPASSIGKKRKIHEISDKTWCGHDSRHRKKIKRGDSKMHSVTSRTA